ncbi:MAG: hypothetical protein K5669_11610 [Lachnospiraceae bacterium]|nr:hypothetical protein [Lachnospiraceae bacterium]
MLYLLRQTKYDRRSNDRRSTTDIVNAEAKPIIDAGRGYIRGYAKVERRK